ncbi:transcriptional repressor [Ottowia thiooxydans]|uniref:transcriptional repressor n=1 Tax=Ottowia thiooxydans TaxID=219182 RepID=UPI00041EBD1F|nr:transcriptional repressor [Ottowia thiooxydans]
MSELTVLQRLRLARLRPTSARIGVLQVVEAAGLASIRAEDVFRRMLERGTPVSAGTIYRCLQKFERAGLLLREWDHSRTAHYRVKPTHDDTQVLRLICPETGRALMLADPDLYARVLNAARRQGLELRGKPLSIQAASQNR